MSTEVQWEYGFESPQAGLYYVTTNEMLVEVMHAARPEARLMRRPVTPWEPVEPKDVSP